MELAIKYGTWKHNFYLSNGKRKTLFHIRLCFKYVCIMTGLAYIYVCIYITVRFGKSPSLYNHERLVKSVKSFATNHFLIRELCHLQILIHLRCKANISWVLIFWHVWKSSLRVSATSLNENPSFCCKISNTYLPTLLHLIHITLVSKDPNYLKQIWQPLSGC